LGGVDRVTEVVSGAVRDESDEGFRGLRSEIGGRSFGASLVELFVEDAAEEPNQIYVLHLVVASDIVGLADPAAFEDRRQRFSVVLNTQPVTGIFALAVNRSRIGGERLKENHGNQLFRKLVRTVVVRTIRQKHRQPISVAPGTGKMVGGGFARGIR